MEKIISLAFNRFKQTALRFFLIYIFGILGFLGLTILFGLVATLGFFVFFLTKQYLIGSIIGVIFLVLVIFAYILLATWVQLAQFYTVMNPSSLKTIDSFKKTKNLIFSYVSFVFLNALFFLGIFYTNVLLFIPFILWTIWGSFVLYAFLEGHRGKLTPLWYSRAKITGRFLKVLSYILVIYVTYGLISVFFIQLDNKVYINFINVLGFLAGPFIASYFYELYLSLPEPTEVKPSFIWIALSIIGWVLFIAVAFAGIKILPNTLPKNWQKTYTKELQKIQNQNLNSIKNIQIN